jgi:7-cyano-7-deazaguanine tRNA-ribosyltransferase
MFYLSEFTNFKGLIATDSGAFQQYMYNKNEFNINPDEIEKFQEDIGSDFSVILDVPVQLTDNYENAKIKVLTTIERAKSNIKNRSNEKCHWFGPIHGGIFPDLLNLSIQEMKKLDFSVFAIGGLVKAFLEYRFDLTLQILLTVKKDIIPNRPIHMFGLGLPQFFSLAVACGCDIMDSAAYILFAKENRYFTLSTGTRRLDELEEFPCYCPICSSYTPKEIKNCNEEMRSKLIAKHNLFLSLSEMKTIRQAIREGNLWELVQTRIRNHPNLVKAMELIRKNRTFFEIFEKVFKTHGCLYTSPLDLYRPSFYRYEIKLIKNYREPKEVKYLIILPELDVKELNSPTIKYWLEQIDNNILIKRELINIIFVSSFYGIIPLDLNNIYPLGQFESIDINDLNDTLYQSVLQKAEIFFQYHLKFYKKCALLIPLKYFNQYNEELEFPINHPIHGIISLLKSKFNLKVSIFNKIEDLLHFFKSDT